MPDGDHLALVHDADAVGQLLRLFHVVRGVEDGHPAGVEVLDPVEDGAPALRVDAHRGLVQIQHPRLVEQRRPDVHPALHAAGVLVHPVLLPVGEADELEHLVHPLGERRPAQAVHPAPEHEVLAPAQVVVQGDVLRHHPDELLDLVRLAGHREAAHVGVAAVGLEQAGEDGDGGGLAGAVGSETMHWFCPRLLVQLVPCSRNPGLQFLCRPANRQT